MAELNYPILDPAPLPTHLARVVDRANQAGEEGSSETFLLTTYVAECFIKTIGVAMCAGLRLSSTTALYRIEYDLVRADSLGVWESTISNCTSQSYSGYMNKSVRSLVEWLTRRRGATDSLWAQRTREEFGSILSDLNEAYESPRKFDVRTLIGQLIQIRNKTKGHGALGHEFFESATPRLREGLGRLLEECPALVEWEWFYLAVRPNKGNVKALLLRGIGPRHLNQEQANSLRPPKRGIYIRAEKQGELLACDDLLQTDWECQAFLLPNGGMSDAGKAEYLDYTTGKTTRIEMARLLAPPASLPPSATEGMPALDVYSNVFGNLPPLDRGYVQRPQLQDELRTRIDDTNHPIITLHGRGGIGKTSLALHLAHTLTELPHPRFDLILWLSARDLELKPSGTSEVRRAVPSLNEVCKLFAVFVGIDPTPEALANVLQDPNTIDFRGILLIFDNFETLDEPHGVHQFLDTHTHIPNKVLITSRERTFKGDYPIEVDGMERPEAHELLQQEVDARDVGRIVTSKRMDEIYEYTNGHPYIMKVLIGEVAKDRRWLPLKSLVPRRADLLDAVFERSFNRLTQYGRWVFLCVANWRSMVSELALLVVLGNREIDVEVGLDECVNLSLIARADLADGSFCYHAPELARIFARKKLDGDPDRLALQEDIQCLQEFGPIKADQVKNSTIDEIVNRFVAAVNKRAHASSKNSLALKALDSRLEHVAELHPAAWLEVARFRRDVGHGDVSYALRRACEEQPNKDVWLARAEHARESSDEATQIASLVSAVDADPADVTLIREVAFMLAKYIQARKAAIPRARRGVYLASVRFHMEKVAEALDATGLSRLAWLFLLEGDHTKGWKYANLGLEKEPTNRHCLKIVERLNDEAGTGQL